MTTKKEGSVSIGICCISFYITTILDFRDQVNKSFIERMSHFVAPRMEVTDELDFHCDKKTMAETRSPLVLCSAPGTLLKLIDTHTDTHIYYIYTLF